MMSRLKFTSKLLGLACAAGLCLGGKVSKMKKKTGFRVCGLCLYVCPHGS